jgi:hypothetical protein
VKLLLSFIYGKYINSYNILEPYNWFIINLSSRANKLNIESALFHYIII